MGSQVMLLFNILKNILSKIKITRHLLFCFVIHKVKNNHGIEKQNIEFLKVINKKQRFCFSVKEGKIFILF